uniref:Ig-like domain-containing protein n=1 Tax=Fundulus heteroclitus TaxID=8078 RepID=A0A3Q2QZR1_FUNHE
MLSSNLTYKPVTVIDWTRRDLGPERVFLFRDNNINLVNQHEQFKNRVELQDRQMKNGNVSLVLKNVTAADSGTYECKVVQPGVRNPGPTICIINLDVVKSRKSIVSDYTLNSADSKPVTVIDWTRRDLGSKRVFLFRDNNIYLDNQHEQFKNRVELQDRQMKNGDVSLVLKNVTAADSGTYESRVVQPGVRNPGPTICIINLNIAISKSFSCPILVLGFLKSCMKTTFTSC